MTLEEARALPLRKQDYMVQINPDGSELHIPVIGRAHIRHVAEDDIMAFIDTDGRLMYIGEDDKGLYKYGV